MDSILKRSTFLDGVVGNSRYVDVQKSIVVTPACLTVAPNDIVGRVESSDD